MFCVIEFEDKAGGGLAIVHQNWMTPRKHEVFWPPYKSHSSFQRALKRGENAGDDWTLYKVKRTFYQTDDLEKAQKKLQLAELTSDINTEAEEDRPLPPKRIIQKPRRILDSSGDDESGNESLFDRPPKIAVKLNRLTKITESERSTANSPRSSQNSPLVTGEILNCSSQELNYSLEKYPSTPPLSERVRVDCQNPELNCTNSQNFTKISSDEFGTLLRLLVCLKNQNREIIEGINSLKTSVTTSAIQPNAPCIPAKLPVTLPVTNNEDLLQLDAFVENRENESSLTLYLSSLGGRDTASITNRILRQIMKDGVAAGYSYFGKRQQKSAFTELKLKAVIINAVKKISGSEVTQKEIEDCIKSWLKHAPQRLKNQKH